MKTATVHDMTPARLRRLAEQAQAPTAAEGIFAAMTDAVFVTQVMLNLWRYEWAEAQFVLHIVSLCGDSDMPVALFDKELAKHAECDERTVRRWRAAYLQKVRRLKSGPLVIQEGEYNPKDKVYARTAYAIAPEVRAAIARAVAEARALPDYPSDRRAALAQTAEENLRDLPGVPTGGRRRTPHRTSRPVMHEMKNAKRALERGLQTLAEMNELQRRAVLAREQQAMRAELEEIKAKAEQLLAALPASDEAAEVEGGTGQNVRYPPAPEHTPTEHANFEGLMARAAGAAQVCAVELALCPPESPPPKLSAEELAAAAIRAEACGEFQV